jgi:hypothetical protein
VICLPIIPHGFLRTYPARRFPVFSLLGALTHSGIFARFTGAVSRLDGYLIFKEQVRE